MSKKTSKDFKSKTPASNAPILQNPSEEPQNVANSSSELTMRTQFGTIQTHLYDRLIQPALLSFGLRKDDEPLRQLVESIVTSIAMRDAYEGYRKIDDICQRYLYYLESLSNVSPKSWEAIELNALCDYWRTQVFMTLIRDSSTIFGLLLPDAQPQMPTPEVLNLETFLSGIDTVLNPRLDATIPIERTSSSSKELYDFSRGISFPWTGFPTEPLFAIHPKITRTCPDISHSFAMANAEQCASFAPLIQKCLKKCLFVDLLFAQHHKLFDEITPAFSPQDILPDDFCNQLESRIQFDKTYQQAYDAILTGTPLSKPLHRSSRLDFNALNGFGGFAAMIQKAASLQTGVYLFHYLG